MANSARQRCNAASHVSEMQRSKASRVASLLSTTAVDFHGLELDSADGKNLLDFVTDYFLAGNTLSTINM